MGLKKTTADDVTPLYPSGEFVAVTPHDTTEYTNIRAILVTVGGTLTLTNNSEGDIDFGTVAAGTLLPVSPKRIMDTGTTATVLALY